MRLEGLEKGVRLITQSGDVVELIEVSADGESARVRFAQTLGKGAANADGSEATLPSDEIITVDGDRFVGPGQTASSSGG